MGRHVNCNACGRTITRPERRGCARRSACLPSPSCRRPRTGAVGSGYCGVGLALFLRPPNQRRPSNHCQTARPGRPNASSPTRLVREIASAKSAGNPSSAPNTTRPPSRAPNAPGTMNAAPRMPDVSAFEDKRIGRTERLPEEMRREPNLAGTCDPTGEPQKRGERQGEAATICGDDSIVDRFGAASETGQPIFGACRRAVLAKRPNMRHCVGRARKRRSPLRTRSRRSTARALLRTRHGRSLGLRAASLRR